VVQIWLVVTAALLALLVLVIVVQRLWALVLTTRARSARRPRTTSEASVRPFVAGPLT
jgi:heme exporter protein D